MKDLRPKRGGISGTCQGGHAGVSCQKEEEGGTCQWFYRRRKGDSFQKEKEWAVRVRKRVGRSFIPKREGMGGTRQMEAV